MHHPVITRLSRDKYDRLKSLANEREVAMADVLREFVRDGLAKAEAEQ